LFEFVVLIGHLL